MATGSATRNTKRNRVNNLKTYWLYFVPGQSKLQNWFCRDFGHIGILTKSLDHWIFIDPTPFCLKINIQEVKGSWLGFPRHIEKSIMKCKALVKITIDESKIKKIKYKWWHFFLPKFVSCVSIVEYVLGIKTRSLTPLGLVKYLKRIEKKPKGPITKITFKKKFIQGGI